MISAWKIVFFLDNNAAKLCYSDPQLCFFYKHHYRSHPCCLTILQTDRSGNVGRWRKCSPDDKNNFQTFDCRLSFTPLCRHIQDLIKHRYRNHHQWNTYITSKYWLHFSHSIFLCVYFLSSSNRNSFLFWLNIWVS